METTSVQAPRTAKKRRPKKGYKAVHAWVPGHLYEMLRKLAVDSHLSVTQVVVQYLEYLQRQQWQCRRPLHGHSERSFELVEPDFE